MEPDQCGMAPAVYRRCLDPLGYEHVDLTSDYLWMNQQGGSEKTVGLRPLRATPELTRQATWRSGFVRLSVKSRRFVRSGRCAYGRVETRTIV